MRLAGWLPDGPAGLVPTLDSAFPPAQQLGQFFIIFMLHLAHVLIKSSPESPVGSVRVGWGTAIAVPRGREAGGQLATFRARHLHVNLLIIVDGILQCTPSVSSRLLPPVSTLSSLSSKMNAICSRCVSELQLQLPLALFSFYGFSLDSPLVRWHVAFSFWKMFTHYDCCYGGCCCFCCYFFCFQIANMPWNFNGKYKFTFCLNTYTSDKWDFFWLRQHLFYILFIFHWPGRYST